MTRSTYCLVVYAACILFAACCWFGIALLAGWVRV
jgi:hypothetical protein